MNSLESPWDFSPMKQVGGYTVEYKDMYEICQGGPVVGTLNVNGISVKGYKFGGPLLSNFPFIYVPVVVRGLVGTKFGISRVELGSRNVEIFHVKYNLVHLHRINDSMLYYYVDPDKMVEKSLTLS